MYIKPRQNYGTAFTSLTVPANGAPICRGTDIGVTMVWLSSDRERTCIALVAETIDNQGLPAAFCANAVQVFMRQECRKHDLPLPKTWYVLDKQGQFFLYEPTRETQFMISVGAWPRGGMDSFVRHTPLVQALWIEYVLAVDELMSPKFEREARVLVQPSGRLTTPKVRPNIGYGCTIVDSHATALATIASLEDGGRTVGVKRDQVCEVTTLEDKFKFATFLPVPMGQVEYFFLAQDGTFRSRQCEDAPFLLIGARVFDIPVTNRVQQ